MIYPGTDLKFRITTTQPDFNLSEDTFEIKIKDQYNRVRQVVTKADCFWDDQGNWYFVMDNVKTGIYFAWFHGRYEDEDYDDQRRDFTDVQELCCVNYHAGPRHHHHKHVVHYEQVWTVSIDGDEYLCDCDGNYVLTSDGKRICFKSNKSQEIDDMAKVRMKMTGDEFLQFMEGRNPDGKIDTIPEMMDAAQGISDDETIQHDVQEQIEQEAGVTYEGDTRTLYINGAKPKPKED